jgi:hypothetical protein
MPCRGARARSTVPPKTFTNGDVIDKPAKSSRIVKFPDDDAAIVRHRSAF